MRASDRRLYSPRIHPDLIRPLYRLARVRGIPMTRIVNGLIEEHLRASAAEIARYAPAIHDRHDAKEEKQRGQHSIERHREGVITA